MKELKLTRSLLSGYYVSVMIGFFLFELIREPIVSIWTTWFVSFLKSIFGIDATTTGMSWLALLFVCFVIVFMIRRFIVEVLNLYSNDEDYNEGEKVILLLLILGFFIYVVNSVFRQPMPSGWFPDVVIMLFGGQSDTSSVLNSTVEGRNTWTIVPWLWTIGPVAFMYFRTIAAKFKTGEQ